MPEDIVVVLEVAAPIDITMAQLPAIEITMAAEQGLQGPAGPAGQGVPAGGTTGQVLEKASNANYDTAWVNAPSSPVQSVFGRTGDVVAEAGDYAAFYVPYNGATADVDLGAFSLSATDVTATNLLYANDIRTTSVGNNLSIVNTTTNNSLSLQNDGSSYLFAYNELGVQALGSINTFGYWRTDGSIRLTSDNGSYFNIAPGGEVSIKANGSVPQFDVQATSANFSGAVTMLGDLNVTQSVICDVSRPGNMQTTGTGGGGFIELLLQTAPPTTSAGLRAFTNNLGYFSILQTDGKRFAFSGASLTAPHTYTMPDADGTLALTSDLAGYVPYTGATNNVNLGTNTLTSPTLIGSTSSGGTLTLVSTSHSTKGKLLFGNSTYDEVNNRVGYGTIFPQSFFNASQSQYSTGTASQSGTTITGSGTTFTADMVGSQFIFADGTSAGYITTRSSATSITVSVSQTVASQAFTINYQGLRGNNNNWSIGADPSSNNGPSFKVGGQAVRNQWSITGANLYTTLTAGFDAATTADGDGSLASYSNSSNSSGTSGAVRFIRSNPSGATGSGWMLGEIATYAGITATTYSAKNAAINFWSSQTQTASAAGSYVTISTTPNGLTTLLERIRFQQDGNVSIGTPSSLAKLAILQTTEQLRLLYDTSNYLSQTVSSAGAVTFGISTGSGAGRFTFSLVSSTVSSAGNTWYFSNGNGNTTTSGTCRGGFFQDIFRPSSGTSTYAALELGPTINQTGGANGITRGLYINPTLTASADFRSFETTQGKIVLADTVSAGSGSLAGGLLRLSQTWNTTGAPTAILLSVTDTASSSSSNLMNLRAGASGTTSIFSVRKDGFFATPWYQFDYATLTFKLGAMAFSTQGGTANANETGYSFTGHTTTASSGVNAILGAVSTINQSGTAGYTGLRINVTETATGSGAKLLASLQRGGTAQFTVDRVGNVVTLGSFVAGASSIAASAVMQADSTTQGFLPPRMTTTQKTTISTPGTGLVVYDTTLNKLCVYTGAAWETVTSI